MFIELLERLRPIRGLPVWLCYLATAVLVLACFGIRMALDGLEDGAHLPLYLIFIPAVVISAFVFDRGSGLLAVGLSGVLGLYFFVKPGAEPFEHVGEVIGLIAFVIIGALSAALIEALRKAVDRLARRTKELTERTEELTATRAELMKANQHRELLLSDINHRIKNHLASVAAGLSISRSHLEDEAAKEALTAAIGRLDVLGRVYTRLHLDGPEVSLDSKDFFEGLCSELSVSLIGSKPVAIIPSIEDKKISAQQAVNLGLIVNELVTNAVKYAFPGNRAGEIHVRYGDLEGECTLQVLDDGIGTPPPAGAMGTGTKLVKALVGQMGGKVDWHYAPGTKVVVFLPNCEG